MAAAEFRLVLDTDVVLSGLRSAIGASRVILLGVEAGALRMLLSVAIMLEYEAVLKRQEHLDATGLTPSQIDGILNAFIAGSELIHTHFRSRPLVRDPDDDLFAEVAGYANADALVSFNVGDYRPVDPRGRRLEVPVCRPGEIVRRMKWEPSGPSRSTFLRP